MTTLEAPLLKKTLPSAYDAGLYTQEQFETELSRVHEMTAIERDWITEAGLEPYETDDEIVAAHAVGKLVKVTRDLGFETIPKLHNWDISRTNPNHRFYYSPNFLRPESFDVLSQLAHDWNEAWITPYVLSITSLVRSKPYQAHIGSMERKLTIKEEGLISSHQVGMAFDVSACDLYQSTETGMARINPREPGYKPEVLKQSQFILRSLLDARQQSDEINYVEELPETQDHIFHVAVKPASL